MSSQNSAYILALAGNLDVSIIGLVEGIFAVRLRACDTT